MVFFMEMKVNGIQMERIRRSCGFTNGFNVEADGSRGGLSLAWKQDIQVTIISYSENYIDAIIK